jgi:hypothetical protein
VDLQILYGKKIVLRVDIQGRLQNPECKIEREIGAANRRERGEGSRRSSNSLSQ